MKTDKELFDEYILEECFIISRKRKKKSCYIPIKEYFVVHEYFDKKNDLWTLECKDKQKTLFSFTINTYDLVIGCDMLKEVCKAITRQSKLFGDPLVTYKYETGLCLGVVVKKSKEVAQFEYFTYKWNREKREPMMIIYQLVDNQLVRLKKTVMIEDNMRYWGDYETLLKGLEDNGFEVARQKRI